MAAYTRLRAVVDISAAQPFLQRHRVDTEVFRDLLDCHSGLAIPRDAHDVVTELGRVGLGHSNILPGPPFRASQIRCHLSVQQSQHPDLRADFVIANPPFNQDEWGGERLRNDPRWKYGVPPAGNANYGWIQHMLFHLSPTGTMATVLANGSLTSEQSGEGEIRKSLVEKEVVECIVALPSQLFFGTQIPVCLWFLTKNKNGVPNGAKTRKRVGETLFIDARRVGFMETRTVRAFTDQDVNRIADAYHAWRGTDTSDGKPYEDVPGFCRSVTTAEIAQHHYVLTPGRYVGAEAAEDDTEALDETIARLSSEIRDGFKMRDELQVRVMKALDSLVVGDE